MMPLSSMSFPSSQEALRFEAPGCYRSLAFQELLARHPEVLELYAQHVEKRPQSAAYQERCLQQIPAIARWLERELAADGRLGLCALVSAILSRLLDELGIWNYIVAGGCVITFIPADMRPRYFYVFDLQHVEVPHAWVVAPPFWVIDLTLRQQRYTEDEGERIPVPVLSRCAQPAAVMPEEVCTPALLQGLQLRGIPRERLLRQVFPEFWRFQQFFPSRVVALPTVRLKYIPARLLLPPWQAEWETMPLLNGKSFRQLHAQLEAHLQA
jgi:hypothetical protein